jgi:hypothetical protein
VGTQLVILDLGTIGGYAFRMLQRQNTNVGMGTNGVVAQPSLVDVSVVARYQS